MSKKYYRPIITKSSKSSAGVHKLADGWAFFEDVEVIQRDGKSKIVKAEKIPKKILGAAWKPQKERMDAGIYFPLYIVLKNGQKSGIYYLPVDYQDREIFEARKPLSSTAKRAGWQGYYFNLTRLIDEGMIRRIV